MNLWKVSGSLILASCFTACKDDDNVSVKSSWDEAAESRLIEQNTPAVIPSSPPPISSPISSPPSVDMAEMVSGLIAEDSLEIGDGGYLVNRLLIGQRPSMLGFKGQWVSNKARSPMKVTSPGLEYQNLQSFGGKIEMPDNDYQCRNARRLNLGYDDTSSGVVYISFLLQIDDVDGLHSYRALELHDSRLGSFDSGLNDKINRKFALGVHAADFNTEGVGFRADNDLIYSGTLSTVRNTDVNLFVLRFDLSDEQLSDSVTVWMNPPIGGEEDPANGVTVSGFDISFDTVTFARFGGTGAYLDEIRVGGSYSIVTPKK